MKHIDILSEVANLKIVPVVKLNSVSDAVPLGEALCAGGLPIAEITFRTEAAHDSISKMTQAFPNMIVGAGTVVNLEQAKQALDAGALFLVSPGISRPVIEFSLDHKVPIFPGACTPSEIMVLLEYGLTIAKFFPAQQYGGLNTIKSLSAPFPSMQFMPTGGVSASNILDYLACDKIIACGGSWMVKDPLVADKNFKEIEALTREAVTLVKGEF
ncbi:MAG: bifunctional 4-hydroxy-2-oxoglutarate aldolase/2-dehydro-3-deoxy-phosphogluconate aldolase [Lachnospiraceae bacterium]